MSYVREDTLISVSEELLLSKLKQYKSADTTMSAAEKRSLLAEIMTITRALEAATKGAAYPFLSPSAILAGIPDGRRASLHEESAPRPSD